MSIAVKDVLERILVQVAAAPAPELELELEVHAGAGLRDPSRNAALGILRLTPRGPAERSSNLHFWAGGLRAFMRARGDEPSFAHLAERCLCRPIDEAALGVIVDRLLGLASVPPPFSPPAPLVGAYEMFADENRISVLMEAPSGFAALYWQSDATLPASRPLLQLLQRHAELEFGVSAGGSWSAVQHDSNLFAPGDARYAWRLAAGQIERLDVDALPEAPRLRFVLESGAPRIRLAWASARGEIALVERVIHGEGRDMVLEETNDRA